MDQQKRAEVITHTGPGRVTIVNASDGSHLGLRLDWQDGHGSVLALSFEQANTLGENLIATAKRMASVIPGKDA